MTIVAHDLGNYLTPLLGRSYILHTHADREGRADDMHDAHVLLKGVQRLQHLTNDLLDVGRIEQGLFTIVRQPINLADLVRTTAAALQTARFVVAVHTPDDLMAAVDPGRLQQALENLLTNAYHHAPGSATTLELRSEQRDDQAWAIVRVQDQGPGIASEMLPRLMDRFARGNRSGGLGIGLYLARRIAEAHGGSLTVESTLGQGTTFQLAIPIHSAVDLP